VYLSHFKIENGHFINISSLTPNGQNMFAGLIKTMTHANLHSTRSEQNTLRRLANRVSIVLGAAIYFGDI
jgi:hypothetical protein